MKIEYAPSPSAGVTTLMAVNDVPSEVTSTVTSRPVLVGATAGLAAAWVLGSKRKILFALIGAGVGYWRSR
jgi:hypothetical protein